MPIVYSTPCIGYDNNEPCIFSVDRIGQPRSCILPDVRCVFCGETASVSPRDYVKPLSILFIQDYSIYTQALGRVRPELLESCRKCVQKALPLMAPRGYMSILILRQDRVALSLDTLTHSLNDGPKLITNIKDEGRVLQNSLPLKKLFPHDVMLNLLVFGIDVVPSKIFESLAETKKNAYSISRHPIFAEAWREEREVCLARAYSSCIQLHHRFLAQLKGPLVKHVSLAGVFKWGRYCTGILRVLTLVQSMLDAPVLPLGSPLCHQSFVPVESP